MAPPTLAAAMQKEVNHMQRVIPMKRHMLVVLAIVAAIAVPSAGLGGSSSSGHGHSLMPWCPPSC